MKEEDDDGSRQCKECGRPWSKSTVTPCDCPPEEGDGVRCIERSLFGHHRNVEQDVDWCPKWLRECLCAQETNAPDEFTREEIGRLIRLLDLHRPIANDGKHRELHTPTCGCEDR